MNKQPGVIFCRRPRGKKLQFIIGGPVLAGAHMYVNWDNVEKSGLVVEWHGCDGQIVALNRKGTTSE